MIKNKIFRYILTVFLSMLYVWFIISIYYIIFNGNIKELVIAEGVAIFVFIFDKINNLLKEEED